MGTGPKDASSQKERLPREAAPGPEGGVSNVVDNNNGIVHQEQVF